MAPNRPKFDRVRTNSVEVHPSCSKSAQSRSDSTQVQPSIVPIWSKSAQKGWSMSAQCRENEQIHPKPAEGWSMDRLNPRSSSVQLGKHRPKSDRCRPKDGRDRSKFGQGPPKSAHIWPNSSYIWPDPNRWEVVRHKSATELPEGSSRNMAQCSNLPRFAQ